MLAAAVDLQHLYQKVNPGHFYNPPVSLQKANLEAESETLHPQ